MAVCLAFALVAVVLAAVVAYSATGDEQDELESEFRLRLIQFLLLAALGAILAFMVELIKRRAEERNRWEEYQTETAATLLHRLDDIYMRVKDTRQHLWRARNGPVPDDKDMWSLRGEQQDLEQLWKDVQLHGRAIEILAAAQPHLQFMEENYLGMVWREYNRNPTSRGKWLTAFITPSANKITDSQAVDEAAMRFRQFATRYQDSRWVLARAIVPEKGRSGVPGTDPNLEVD